MDLYKCNKCEELKTIEYFCKDKNRKNGVTRWCKKCLSEQNKKWKLENADKVKNDIEIYRKENKEKIKIKHAEYKLKNKEKIKEHEKEYRKTHKEEIRKLKKEYYHNVEKHDIQTKITNNLRSRICKVLIGISKSQHTMVLIGCDIVFFIKYIEDKFKSGMSWENYGFGQDKWHIDHIRPCISFDLTTEEEQRKCFHYTNLQPLWQPENCSKGGKWDGLS